MCTAHAWFYMVRDFYEKLVGLFKHFRGEEPRSLTLLGVGNTIQQKQLVWAYDKNTEDILLVPLRNHKPLPQKAAEIKLFFKNHEEVLPSDIGTLRTSQIEEDGFVVYNSKEQPHEFWIGYSQEEASWNTRSRPLPIEHPGVVTRTNKGQYILVSSTPNEILICTSKTGATWNTLGTISVATIEGYFHHTPLRIITAESRPEGILVIFDASYHRHNYHVVQLGACLLAHDNPLHIHWKLEMPLWEKFIPECPEPVTILGVLSDEEFTTVYLLRNEELHYVQFHNRFGNLHVGTDKPHLEKPACNPIIVPNPANDWEANATFNPAALKLDGKVHLLYRTEGRTGLSKIGYGSGHDGTNFETHPRPAYVPRADFEGIGVPSYMRTGFYASGYSMISHACHGYDGWHGCEDPRVTVIDNRVYMSYSAFKGYGFSQLAITSISVDDFLNQRWEHWTEPQPMIPEPKVWGEGAKNAAILPEKVNGKYVIFHRIFPNICIDYVDDLDFSSDSKWLCTKDVIRPSMSSWDNYKIAVGATPIKTKHGWLVIYEGLGYQDRVHYKIGAMLLDLKDPTKVLYRSPHPIIAPYEWYEHNGSNGITYACGAVIHNKKLYVYYGGLDRYVCVAETPIKEFLKELMKYPYQEPVLLPASTK